MATPEEITESIKKLGELSRTVSDYLNIENMSVRMIKDDVTFMKQNLTQLVDQVKAEEKRLEDIKAEAKNIIAEAKKEAENLIKIERENLAFTVADRNAAQRELEEARSKSRLAEKKLDKMVNYEKDLTAVSNSQ